jgi:hypothetical protein
MIATITVPPTTGVVMQERGLERFAPLAGIVFLVLIVAAFLLSGETPGADDKTADVVKDWADSDSRQVASAILGTLGAIALVWFGGSLRDGILRGEGGTGRLAALAFAGTVITAVGGASNSAIQLAVADTVGDVPPEVTQTLSVLYSDFFFPMVVGFALMLFATALAVLRGHAAFPRWFGWVSLVLGVILLTPVGFFAFLVGLLWVGVASVLLFRAQEPPAAAAPAAV